MSTIIISTKYDETPKRPAAEIPPHRPQFTHKNVTKYNVINKPQRVRQKRKTLKLWL